MKYYIKQKVFSLGDKYYVYNENEQPVFTVEGELFSFGARIHLYTMQGDEVFFIQQKVMTFLPKYEIFRRETLCAEVVKEFSLFSPRLSVSSQFGDFSLDGEIFGMDFTISAQGRLLGSITKEWFTFGDAYVLDIAEGEDDAFFVALVIAIDHCLHNGD